MSGSRARAWPIGPPLGYVRFTVRRVPCTTDEYVIACSQTHRRKTAPGSRAAMATWHVTCDCDRHAPSRFARADSFGGNATVPNSYFPTEDVSFRSDTGHTRHARHHQAHASGPCSRVTPPGRRRTVVRSRRATQAVHNREHCRASPRRHPPRRAPRPLCAPRRPIGGGGDAGARSKRALLDGSEMAPSCARGGAPRASTRMSCPHPIVWRAPGSLAGLTVRQRLRSPSSTPCPPACSAARA